MRGNTALRCVLLASLAALLLSVAPAVADPPPPSYGEAVLADTPSGYWRLGDQSGTRDGVGNPTQIGKVGGVVETYQYDALDRLTEVCYQASCSGSSDPFIRWSYDEVGNRLTEARPAGTTTYGYDNADQLTEQSGLGGTVNYTYDDNGNLLSKGGRTFVWDLAGRLAGTTLAGTTVAYGYDGEGKRLSETDGTAATRFVWDRTWGLPQLALERNGTGSLLRRYHHGLAPVSMRTVAGEDFSFHADGLGSIANLTSPGGVTQWTYEYEPYGTERVATPASGAPVNRVRFSGQYDDVHTGLYHLRARHYDPANGRFLSPDPVAQEITDPYVAAYLYVSNRPTVLVDPTGLSAQRAVLPSDPALYTVGFFEADAGMSSGFLSPVAPGAYGDVACVRVGTRSTSWCFRPAPAEINAEPVAAGPVRAAGAASKSAGKLATRTWKWVRGNSKTNTAAKAGTGGINAVRLGQAGEDAVRAAYNIGDKVPIRVAGRGRIPDGVTPTTVSEVKNVASLSYTQQLRDFAQYAQRTGRSFDLYVRPTTRLSGPLQDAVASGSVNLRFIP